MVEGKFFRIPKEFFCLSLHPLDYSSSHCRFLTTVITIVAEMADLDADLGSVLGTEGGTKKTGGDTQDGADNVAALNTRLDDSVGEEGDSPGVARCYFNLSVWHQAVKGDGSNRNCQEQGMPTSRGDRCWLRREQ